jgi:hypothetical protein
LRALERQDVPECHLLSLFFWLGQLGFDLLDPGQASLELLR